MNSYRWRMMAGALPFLLLAPIMAQAQQFGPPGPPPNGPPPPPPPGVTDSAYSPEQLDQMLAPIALYPDQLLTQVLMAATYPLQVVEAARWLQDPRNAGLHGDALVAALEPLQWDPSVKSLVPFPQIITMLNTQLDWTQSLGSAFANQQADVMARVQVLRQEAREAGKLQSTPQMLVQQQGPDIMIEPANPEVVYVPVYNPSVVYGAWPYQGYPPYYFPPPPGFFVGGIGLGIGFSVGFGIVGPLWGWGHPDWHDHHIIIDNDRYARVAFDHRAFPGGNTWHHEGPVARPAFGRAGFRPPVPAGRPGEARPNSAPRAAFPEGRPPVENRPNAQAPREPGRGPGQEAPRAAFPQGRPPVENRPNAQAPREPGRGPGQEAPRAVPSGQERQAARAPTPQARPAPAARPAAIAPQQRPAPQAARPAPQAQLHPQAARPAEKKDEKKDEH